MRVYSYMYIVLLFSYGYKNHQLTSLSDMTYDVSGFSKRPERHTHLTLRTSLKYTARLTDRQTDRQSLNDGK